MPVPKKQPTADLLLQCLKELGGEASPRQIQVHCRAFRSSYDDIRTLGDQLVKERKAYWRLIRGNGTPYYVLTVTGHRIPRSAPPTKKEERPLSSPHILPTNLRPGSLQKIDLLQKRVELGLPTYIRGDQSLADLSGD